MRISPAALAVVSLLALPSAAVFLLDRMELFVAVALLNVVLITASVYLMFGGREAETETHSHAEHA
ncbi:hypothetical protein N0B31_19215 [Salinirubellus salinus]|jgi:hypothetical protein|uniref:DUF8131 domain-containing protein n=1 Tax=Salinirubellus salinus TaxID=1364945 RepID=A0A9E7R2B3_9EURY|nr:hypothetical protein [Salinirubellus salinus]UWM54232.1 hypothetical protein N0B31_19215 [Salinirubellus salinus]